MSNFVPYREWSLGAERRATPRTHPIGSTKGITAHWEGPRMGGFPHSACARKVRAIRRFHIVYRGWADIAYNLVVCPHGYVFEGRGANTKSAANGSTQANEDWYAVCYLGGLGDGFTAPGADGFRDAFDWLTLHGDAGPARNGHRDHKATTCPGDQIYRWVHSDFEEDDMPTAKQVADEIFDHRVEVTRASGKATEVSFEQAVREIFQRSQRIGVDEEALADAVAKRLPAGTFTGVAVESIKGAVKDAVRELVAEG